MAEIVAAADKRPVESLGIVHGFHPGWFGAVMGTAVIGVIAYANPGNSAGLMSTMHGIAAAAVIIAAALAVVLGVPYIWRWIQHPKSALSDLRHPVVGPLYGTFPGGLLVLAIAIATVGPHYMSAAAVNDIVATLTWIGAPLAFAISVVFGSLLFLNPDIEAPSANGGWSIPPVVNIVIPLALIGVLPTVSPSVARALLFLGYATWGIGLILFVLISSLLFDRLVFHPLPHASLAPSLWIMLGPLGAGGLALLRLGQESSLLWGSAAATVETVSMVVALILWGFGIWWLVTALILLLRYLFRGGIPFGIGLWAFTFPLGAFTALTLTLSRALNLTFLEDTSVVLFVGLLIFWAVVAVSTVVAVINGKAWAR